MHIFVYSLTSLSLRFGVYTYLHGCLHLCASNSLSKSVCVCLCVFVCVCLCMTVCVSVNYSVCLCWQRALAAWGVKYLAVLLLVNETQSDDHCECVNLVSVCVCVCVCVWTTAPSSLQCHAFH